MKLRVWIIVSRRAQGDWRLTDWGNGVELQYPAFATRKEARHWLTRGRPFSPHRIIRATIEYAPPEAPR